MFDDTLFSYSSLRRSYLLDRTSLHKYPYHTGRDVHKRTLALATLCLWTSWVPYRLDNLVPSSAIAPLGIQSSCDCHLATHTSKHFVPREIAYMPYVRCDKTAFRYACASIMRHLLALHRHKVTSVLPGLCRTLDAKDLREEAAFPLPLNSHCQHSASLSILFCRLSEKFFRNQSRACALPAWDGYHPVRKSFVPEIPFRVKYFFRIFSHFYLQLF